MDTPSVTTNEEQRRLPTWVIVAAFVVLLVFLGLIAWGMNRSQQPPIQIGDRVPPFAVYTFDGKQLNTTDMTGKVVLVNFWASWCKPCEQEAAELEQAWQHYKDGGKVVFVGLAWVDTEPESLGYIKKFGITYPNGPDLRTTVSQMFRTRGVPETYILDQQGKLASVKIGPYDSLNEIITTVDQILKN